jgi:predicted DCC family thiol-disulfide oxidoreductase YuxK
VNDYGYCVDRFERFLPNVLFRSVSLMSIGLKNQNESQSSTVEFADQIEVFYDGECLLCRREIAFLRTKDRKRLIHFRDIQRIDFASAGIPKTYQQLMAEIHGRLPDGTWIKGVEVFRRLYDAIGWNWIVAITRWPVVREFLDWAYQIFAKRRLALTGRCLNSCEVKQG